MKSSVPSPLDAYENKYEQHLNSIKIYILKMNKVHIRFEKCMLDGWMDGEGDKRPSSIKSRPFILLTNL